MVDILSPEERSRLMARIGPKGSRPELRVQAALEELGIPFRTHAKDLPGTPDFVLDHLHAVIFVHGCFWHRHPGCRYAYTPRSRVDFWQNKFIQNVRRDRRVARRLRAHGWSVITIWECGTRDTDRLRNLLRRRISRVRSGRHLRDGPR